MNNALWIMSILHAARFRCGCCIRAQEDFGPGDAAASSGSLGIGAGGARPATSRASARRARREWYIMSSDRIREGATDDAPE
jgi:hypothetical protein